MIPIPNLSEVSLRFGRSATEAVAMASAYLLDLIEADIVPPECSSLALDASKLKRGRDKVMKEASIKREEVSLNTEL